MKKYIGFIFICVGIVVASFVFYVNSRYAGYTRTYSDYTLLKSSWEKYKVAFISKDGRVIDYSNNAITTSEGQSYALLRAVWMDDKETFDLVWKFTQDNMKRKNDNLYGWKWGKLGDNSYGFLPDGGDNSASDADSDIALALIFAGNRWSTASYRDQAKPILADLWSKETAVANGKRYMIAGNWGQTKDELIVNPSYFAPYAWRVFATVDREHDWKSLISPAYALLTDTTAAPLDQKKSGYLPPDWIAITTKDGQFKATTVAALTTRYSYDAVRVPWRIALDYQWNHEAKAYDYLKSMTGLYDAYTRDGNKLMSSYAHDGNVIENFENPTMYATSLGYFMVAHPEIAKQIYQEKIISLYSTDKSSFNDSLGYYEQNWLWFGAGLYTNSIVPY